MNTIQSMLSRYTVRAYSEEIIEDQLLNSLLETACRSSNTGNMQLYSVVVTRDQAGKQALAPAHFNQKQVTTAPVVLTVCADLNRVTAWCNARKAEAGFDNLQALTYAAIDAVIMAQTFCVAAEEAGLGICYLGTTTYNAEKIIDALNLPALVLPVVTLSVGWPLEKATGALPDRLPLSGIVHQEQYSGYAPEEVDAIYAAKEALEESVRFVEINQKETLAQVYAEIRYKKADNEFFSTEWLRAIRKQGFKI